MEKFLAGEIQSISKRVDCLEKGRETPPAKRRATEVLSSWAEGEPMDFRDRQSQDIVWPVSEDEGGDDPSETDQPPAPTIRLSEDEKRVVTSAFKMVLSMED